MTAGATMVMDKTSIISRLRRRGDRTPQPKGSLSQDNNEFQHSGYRFSNLTVYDMLGSPVSHSGEVVLKGFGQRNDEGKVYHHKDGRISIQDHMGLMSVGLPMLYAMMESAYDRKDTQKGRQFIDGMKNFIAQQEIFTYSLLGFEKDFATHSVLEDGESMVCFLNGIPQTSMRLEDAVKDKSTRSEVQALFMSKDPRKIPEVMSEYGNEPTIWVSSSDRERVYGIRVGRKGFNGGIDIMCDASPNAVGAIPLVESTVKRLQYN